MVCHVLFGRSRMVTWPSWPIAPFPHSGLSFGTVQKKSMTVCAMYEIYTKFILKCVTKRTGMEHETVLLIATIVGTGKSIDFYIFVKVSYYPLLALACTCCLIHIVIVYCIWSYIVIVIWINWFNLNLI